MINMENVIISYFKVESEAFQAFSDLKKGSAFVDQFALSQVALLKKSNGHIIMEDGFDTGKRTLDYTLKGGLIGALVGVLGGPLGMLLGFGVGSVVGMAEDTGEAMEEENLISAMTSRMKEGDVAMVAVVQELSEKSYDIVLEKFDAETVRYSASSILEEIEHARGVELKLQEQAKKEMRKERSEHRKGKVEEYRSKFKEEFAELRKRFSSRD
ncbi:DUF1269 domain-containing protein [Planococcus sp. ISL-109]|uniref:DUF1269 domain-containing protein n=1 Tax=Planococcus sp. ISL-109 TaxID=2819166 RepID=UPI001BE703B4|nr:DUF1269 domain-containing protein [Planococcus sp. ISL-109]MBT2582865.1 DUF1269 domain-containing protein [Planococcus sp. ISL-109]